MNASTKQLEQSIRELSVADLLALHEQLIAQIHDAEEGIGLEPAFRADIERRVKEIDVGKAKGVDAFRALKRM